MQKQTESIDRLFLELSQFTSATTEKELKLAKALKGLMRLCPDEFRGSEEWDAAVILLDCSPVGANLS